jgi:hypothetical protein
MKLLGVILATSAACTLSGCFFFYIPGSAVSAVSDTLTGSFGNKCIGESVKVGDRIRIDGGGTGTVTRISGPSSRCQDGRPIRAEVTYD